MLKRNSFNTVCKMTKLMNMKEKKVLICYDFLKFVYCAFVINQKQTERLFNFQLPTV